MEITICKTAGLCAGASKSYYNVIDNLKKHKRTVVYKQLLHNESLIENLKSQGAIFTEDLSEIKKDDFVVLRAHGEEKCVYDKLAEIGVDYVDSICHNVKKIHDLAVQKENEGYHIIILGNIKDGEIHDEVKGLMSFLQNRTFISNIEDARNVEFVSDKKYFVVCQTTFSESLYNKIVEILESNASKQNIEIVANNTICNFTFINLKNSIELAMQSDIAIVVGSKNSSNTKQIYMATKDLCYTIFSNDFDEIKKLVHEYVAKQNLSFENLKICILAGASTLKDDLKKLEIQLKFHLI